MEKIEFANGIVCDLASGNTFDGDTIRITFLPGTYNFDTVEAAVKASKSIKVTDAAGKALLVRSAIVYAGSLSKEDHRVIQTEQIQTGADELGVPVYETRDVVGTVMTAAFRVPDLREDYAALEAKMEYMAMMSNIDLEGV
ncbi:MAG: hypothetical protein RR466_11255 [Hungatella sp.]